MRKFSTTVLVALIGFGSCIAQSVKVESGDGHIHYMGRVKNQPNKAAEISWSGSAVKINFKGTGIKAVLKDQYGQNFYNVIVDGVVIQRIQLDTAKTTYTLAANLSPGKHNLELFKLTEWAMGKTWFYQFELDKGSAILEAPATKKRKIEFFGNSITCGFAVEDTTGKDRGSAPYENNYISYAALTARHFDAEYYCTARSGIGVLVSWAPLIMPEMYNRTDATDPDSKWDFKKYTPDVVVINLFQNDSWIVTQPQNAQFKARFGTTAPSPETIVKAYQGFVATLRKTYPKAQIICALGSMDATRDGSPWPGYIKQAVENLNDKNVYTCIFPFKGTNGHPSAKEQQAMANQLIAFIDKNIKW